MNNFNDDTIMRLLEERLVGQPHAIEATAGMVYSYLAGIGPQGRPAGVALLLGPTGSGKTRTVEALAEVLHGSAKNLLRIDCGEFQMEHEVAKLIGAPPGYLGHRETMPMLNQANVNGVASDRSDLSLILFDEIEKAAPSMTRLLLGVLDKATLRLGDNSNVNFERTLIFMTSNLGADSMMKYLNPSFGLQGVHAKSKADQQEPFSMAKLQKIGVEAVKKKFSPEFVNRVDEIITYAPLGKEEVIRILEITLENFQKHLNNRLGLTANQVYLEDEAKDWLITNGVSLQYGARNLKRLIHKKITIPLARQLTLKDIKPREDVLVGLDVEANDLVVRRYDKRPRRKLAA